MAESPRRYFQIRRSRRYSYAGTDQRNGVSFDRKEGRAVAGWIGGDEFGAHAHVARHARNCAEWRRTQNVAHRKLGSGRAGQAFVLRESGVADGTTADSLVVDRHAPQQDGQTGKSKLLARSCLRILVQSLRANASPLIKEPTT